MKPVHANRHTRIMQTWLYCKNDRISISPHAAGQAAVLPHDHATHGHSCMIMYGRPKELRIGGHFAGYEEA